MTLHRTYLSMSALLFACLTSVLCLTTHAAGQEWIVGKDAFAKRCSGCHAIDSNKEGPRLRGVLGRRAGSVQGFQYSDPLRKSGITCDEASLNQWLENSQALVKDNDMEFRVTNAAERAAILAYLKSLK